MKRIFTLLGILLSMMAFSQQNQSDGSVSPAITNPNPIANEIFRFQPGQVTQLDQGSIFNPSSRFFTLGRFANGSQTGYGLRLVAHGRALGFGYPNLNSLNPQITWKGTNSSTLGNLEFRYSPTFAPGNTQLTATMRKDFNSLWV